MCESTRAALCCVCMENRMPLKSAYDYSFLNVFFICCCSECSSQRNRIREHRESKWGGWKDTMLWTSVVRTTSTLHKKPFQKQDCSFTWIKSLCRLSLLNVVNRITHLYIWKIFLPCSFSYLFYIIQSLFLSFPLCFLSVKKSQSQSSGECICESAWCIYWNYFNSVSECTFDYTYFICA